MTKPTEQELQARIKDLEEEINQLNLTLLHQQKISSQNSKSTLAQANHLLEKEVNSLKEQNNNLQQSLNNLNILETNNKALSQEISELITNLNNSNLENNRLRKLINQNQSLSNWLIDNKETVLVLAGTFVVGYLILKK